jgi:serine protease SohB
MEFLFELGLFAAKTFLIVGAILVVVAGIFIFALRGRSEPELEVEKLNHRYRDLRHLLQVQILDRKSAKQLNKTEKKLRKKDDPQEKRVFVLDFHGDIRASAVESLREEVTAICSIAKSGEQVILRLESPGGMVTAYGLAASQLERLREHGLLLTVCIDKVAASGGYMMACVANEIVAAPFAVVGSIGVIAQVPNFNRILKNHNVDYFEVTAGQFKRTVTLFGEITQAGMEKFKTQIEETHVLFKDFVLKNRPQLDLTAVGTGEHWYGSQATQLRLVDEIRTSDEYLYRLHEKADLFLVKYHIKKRFAERVSDSLGRALHAALVKVWSDLETLRFGS